ncbi:hypothetical protein [Nitrosopumilus sp.]|uniref:hypothetical protein n=1 Tax=Nitrosopumilus sp. TaxID=2024843 RepID=UPI0029313D46|nr:hypothetical protein [Nitrosopumilus sp.]
MTNDFDEILLKDESNWKTLCLAYGALSSSRTRSIMHKILNQEGITSSELKAQTNLTDSQFHSAVRLLFENGIIEKRAQLDRTVQYHITPFAKHVLKISAQLLERIDVDANQELGMAV